MANGWKGKLLLRKSFVQYVVHDANTSRIMRILNRFPPWRRTILRSKFYFNFLVSKLCLEWSRVPNLSDRQTNVRLADWETAWNNLLLNFITVIPEPFTELYDRHDTQIHVRMNTIPLINLVSFLYLWMFLPSVHSATKNMWLSYSYILLVQSITSLQFRKGNDKVHPITRQ